MNYLKAEPSDISTIAGFQVAMALETEGLKLNKAEVEKGIKHLFDHPEKGTYWAIKEGEELIGCTLTVPEWSDWRNGTVLWIHSVYVIPKKRSTGAFRNMYEFLKEMVNQDNDLMGLRLYVDKRNEKAMRVYEKLGMNSDHYALYEWMKNY